MKPVDRGSLQSIPVAQSFRDEMDDIAPQHFEGAAKDDRGGNTVDVVIAMNRNPLAARECLLQPIDSPVHIRQAERVV